jgi:hypothetical protein
LKDACYTLRMEQPRPLDGSKVQTLVNVLNGTDKEGKSLRS